MKTFSELIEEKKGINKVIDIYDTELKKFENTNGSVSDEIRNSLTFKTAKKNFNIWFKKLQDINILINRNYKKENREFQLQNRFKAI